ncbi:hypothetical protein EVAR_78119_1 [Eumeta japonica]|uniref:G-protein coupled receptors family 1 profile domain-containing protein n=1 Tax=Eumeta variegata TaxID=151549 RepID=A0A4C1T1J0_EUMVA|nr:hypothetical protein EVAR_78119_1 [Eumeta japonica]
MANESQILMDIFQIIAHSGNSTNGNIANDDQIMSAWREQAVKGRGSETLETMLVKMMADAKIRLNLSVKPEECDYCEGNFRAVVEDYKSMHGYVSLLVCSLGLIANTMNVAVLTRRDLAAAPINRLLKWLAVADVFVMLEYMPFAIYSYMVNDLAVDQRVDGLLRLATSEKLPVLCRPLA